MSELNLEEILEPHREATLRLVAGEELVLAVQGTTSLTYGADLRTEGAAPQEVRLHDTLAFTPAGVPLGLVDVEASALDARQHGEQRGRPRRAVEKHASQRWLRGYRALSAVRAVCPHTTLVSVGDRETDVYDLFVLATGDPGGAHLLVRAAQDRLVAEGQERLWQHVQGRAAASTAIRRLPRARRSPARRATLEIRFAPVSLAPPMDRRSLPPVEAWAVLASELDAPAGIEPLEWMLLSSLPVATAEEAIEKLDWYAERGGVEIFHKVLASGCRIEERQHAEVPRLEERVALDLVTAWRIFRLKMLRRQVPDPPCTVFLEDGEWKALIAFRQGVAAIPSEPPSLGEATRRVAGLGGFLGRAGGGEPGVESLWLGLERLDTIGFAWRAFGPDARRPPGRPPPPDSSA